MSFLYGVNINKADVMYVLMCIFNIRNKELLGVNNWRDWSQGFTSLFLFFFTNRCYKNNTQWAVTWSGAINITRLDIVSVRVRLIRTHVDDSGERNVCTYSRCMWSCHCSMAALCVSDQITWVAAEWYQSCPVNVFALKASCGTSVFSCSAF